MSLTITEKMYYKDCFFCGEELTKHSQKKFCSRECFIKFITEKKKEKEKEIIPRYCPICDKKIIGTETTFCSTECFGKSIKGIPRSENVRIRIGEGNKGENHYRWKGGIENQRDKCRVRDNNTCQLCGLTKEVKLDIHHIIPVKEFGKEDFIEANNLHNLICLCRSCHMKIHFKKRYEKYKPILKKIAININGSQRRPTVCYHMV